MSLQEFATGSGVNITVPLIDQNGNAFSANAISFRLVDEAGNVILPWQPPLSFLAGSQEAVINIFGMYNTLAEGVPYAARIIEIKAVTSGGTILVSEMYMIVSGQPLALGTNSFVTHAEAVMLTRTMAGLDTWLAETRPNQIKALMQAFSNIGHLKVRTGYSKRVTELTLTEIQTLNKNLVDALKRAQLIEANHLLSIDPEAAAMREDGVVMMDVGESKQQWRPTKALVLHAAKATYKALSGWIDNSIRIGRSS